MDTRPRCWYCRHQAGWQCRRYPPTPLSVLRKDAWGNDITEIEYHQPAVGRDESCGEFRYDKAKFAAAVLTDGGK